MSLLNDALRDLDERRQGDAGTSPIPPGLQDNRSGTGMVWLLGAALLLVSLLAVWFWWSGGAASQPAAVVEQVPVTTPELVAQAPDPEVSPVVEPVVAEVSAPESQAAAQAPQQSSADRAPEPQAPREPAVVESTPQPPARQQPEPTAAASVQAPLRSASSPASVTATASTPESAASNVRQLSPQQQEQRAADAISAQLSRGDVQGATHQAQARVLLDPEAPQTRAVMAGYWLRQQDPRQAREWLPDNITTAYPELRLLRARTELMAQQPEQALSWLTRSLPPVATHSTYHVTLAALQQQLGRHEPAAMTWAALIEYDDARADWWAGLGIALEGQGRQESARRAFVQASELPGLSSALQNYVQQRLSQPTTSTGSR